MRKAKSILAAVLAPLLIACMETQTARTEEPSVRWKTIIDQSLTNPFDFCQDFDRPHKALFKVLLESRPSITALERQIESANTTSNHYVRQWNSVREHRSRYVRAKAIVEMYQAQTRAKVFADILEILTDTPSLSEELMEQEVRSYDTQCMTIPIPYAQWFRDKELYHYYKS